ncbi:MAG: hypothetical protein Q7T55_21695, partial [Solirubrobacteraceae bacterium]|nr:hypothetical protein [Solirubrobacteraceae bacterium]
APATQAWLAGGNTGITTDGSNFIGTRNPAPLVFKTTPTGGTPQERMRIVPGGRVGVGTPAPGARLDVATTEPLAVRGTSTSTTSTAAGLTGVSAAGRGVNGVSANLYGVYGQGGYCGVRSEGGTYGTIASGTSIGVYGSAADYAVYGAGGTYGLFASGASYGAYGSGATGLRGTGTTTGVHGSTTNVNGASVLGEGGQWGVHGRAGRTAGVLGESGYVGVWGEGTSYGVFGLSTDTVNGGYGVFGQANNSASYAVYAQGNCRVSGTLSKSAGSFQIDHPLDPERRWLSHSFVESPDMMNVYNGVVVLGPGGAATVELPSYFEALNRDFRYQLTPIGGAAPDL